MSKTQKTILLCIIVAVTIAMCGLALRSCLNEPIRVDNTDSLKVFIDLAKKRADSLGINAENEKRKSDEILNSPIDYAKRDSLGAAIERKAKADSIRRGSIR